ncbi:MAG: hypothetical protein JXB46_01430 [Candidatus Eisenbacteria bacterium]|nr:hypothetical protein [Candidatus Eisenbacteria bacterium]
MTSAPVRPSLRRLAVAVCVVVSIASLSGCCPGGQAVLESLTLTAEEETGGCSLWSGPVLTSDPFSLIGDLERIPDRSTAAAVAELVGVPALKGQVEHGVKYVYAAVYRCSSGDSEVGVSAVMFKEPVGTTRAARLSDSPMGVIFKGQLAAIVWTRGEGCDDCYDVLLARAQRIMGAQR